MALLPHSPRSQRGWTLRLRTLGDLFPDPQSGDNPRSGASGA
jgi:hypothetical protein